MINGRTRIFSSENIRVILLLLLPVLFLGGLLIYNYLQENNVNPRADINLSALTEQKMKNIVINEVCSQSYSKAYDTLGSKYDYIELYNSNSESVILSDLYLSDDKTDLWKCKITKGGILPANGYLVVFASGLTTNRSSVNLNLNFKVAAGETIYLSYKGKVIDSVVVPEMDFEQVYARDTDGIGEFKITSGSPKSSNNGVNFIPLPSFSVNSGFYDEDFLLEIRCENNCEIYYTLDSSEPTINSLKYNQPLIITDASVNENVFSAITNIVAATVKYTPPDYLVDKATIVRAIAVDGHGNTSSIATSSYFVGFQEKEGYSDVGVLSLVADPDDLFGSDGIYVTGAKYDEAAAKIIEEFNAREEVEYDKDGKEITLNTLLGKVGGENYYWRGINSEKNFFINVFSNSKTLSSSQTVGIRIHGNSRHHISQKKLRLYSRKLYDGNGVLPDELLNNDFNYEQSLLLFPANNFRGFFVNSLIADRAISTQDYKLFQTFINGEYWGTYNVTERYTTEYIAKHYGVNLDNIVVTSGTFLSGNNSSLSYDKPHKYAEKNDLSDPTHYEKISQMMDIQSFIDWVCVTVYTTDADTTENINLQMWRSIEATYESPYADGKWRWMLYDTDTATSMSYKADTFSQATHWSNVSIMEGKLFSNLLKNDSFRERFVLSFMDIANYNFNSEKANVKIDEIYNEYEKANIIDQKRWGSSFFSQVNTARDFFDNRFNYAAQHLADNMNLTGKLVNLTLTTSEENSGNITLNTITPELTENTWNGKYYTDYPVTVTANPNPGYKFLRWEITGGKTDNLLTNQTVSINFSGDTTITAVFGIT